VVEGPPQLAPRAVGFLKKSNATRVIPENCTTTKKDPVVFWPAKEQIKIIIRGVAVFVRRFGE
jgi:hypothetical protein